MWSRVEVAGCDSLFGAFLALASLLATFVRAGCLSTTTGSGAATGEDGGGESVSKDANAVRLGAEVDAGPPRALISSASLHIRLIGLPACHGLHALHRGSPMGSHLSIAAKARLACC